MKPQHPLARRFSANAQRRETVVYTGERFAVASLTDGKRVGIRVDIPKPP